MRDSGPPERSADDRLERVLTLVRFLRANCPWDAAQTPTSLLPYLLEEAYEVADAVQAGPAADLATELGDLLLNVAFQIVLAEERGAFDAEAVVTAVEAKMRRRHPHLYGDGEAESWAALKARERPATSLVNGLPSGLEPLLRAHRIQERVATVGFDWPDPNGALEKVLEEVGEVRQAIAQGSSDEVEDELGDLLFAVVNLARLAGTHPIRALIRANRKFSDRFSRLERLAHERGIALETAGLDVLEGLWQDVKARRGGNGD